MAKERRWAGFGYIGHPFEALIPIAFSIAIRLRAMKCDHLPITLQELIAGSLPRVKLSDDSVTGPVRNVPEPHGRIVWAETDSFRMGRTIIRSQCLPAFVTTPDCTRPVVGCRPETCAHGNGVVHHRDITRHQ